MKKSWEHLGNARPVRRRAPARGIGFLTAVFAALVVITGLDTIFPGVTHKLIPKLRTGPDKAGFRHAKEPFQWSQVC